ncbi:putative membrane protein [Bartonella silvatica]|uniref:Membrane protein n=1 Tax=Bartonella silvatica TaxID=357760 RepID=A0ABV2HFQ5_9HYPH
MVKIFKNYRLNIFILAIFFLSQTINVNANYLPHSLQKENISVTMIEQQSKAFNIADLYVSKFIYEEKNKDLSEGKIEKVFFEPITLGVFTTLGALGFGIFTGVVAAILSGIIGISIGKSQR